MLLGKLLKTTLITLAVVLSLASVGLDLSTLCDLHRALLGVGVGLGLCSEPSPTLFSGVVLLLDKSIKPGDIIQVGGTYWLGILARRPLRRGRDLAMGRSS